MTIMECGGKRDLLEHFRCQTEAKIKIRSSQIGKKMEHYVMGKIYQFHYGHFVDDAFGEVGVL
jgi:hypothetical protein